MNYIITALFCLIALLALIFFYICKYFLHLIEDLTDKVMARTYQDYAFGQEIKKGEQPETVHRARSDKAEAVIEEMNRKAQEATDKLKGLDGKLKNTIGG